MVGRRICAYVLRLGEHAGAELVGEKATSLTRLLQAGLPVPDGFTVTTAAHAAFMRADGLGGEIGGLADALPEQGADELERVTGQVRELIVSRELPADVAAAIVAAYDELGENAAVAVRSSGVGECAGLHDAYLGIEGAGAVLDAVRRCWASLWTAGAARQRAELGLDHDAGLAVVVQAMVTAEISGVLFTANPMTGATDEVVVRAAGDAYVVRAGRVIERTLGDDQPSPLSDAALAEVASLAGLVQDVCNGRPQEIAWGRDGERFQLLLARPVTMPTRVGA